MICNHNDTISELMKNSIDRIDFCNNVISLDADSDFDEYMADSKDMSEIFELCIRYLDNETTDREDLWSRIKSIVK